MNPTPLHCRHPQDLEIEGELAIADGARAQGDWKHALHHYLNALGLDPLALQAVTELRRLQAQHDVLGMLEDNHYVGAHVARAYLLADKGEREQALAIIAAVDEALPELGAVTLLVEWFDPAIVSPEGRRALYGRLGAAGQIGIGRVRLLPGERAAVAPYAELAGRLATVETDSSVLGVASGILRRAGRYEEALAAAERARDLGGTSALIALALAHRVGGKPEIAAEMFEQLFEQTEEPVYLMEHARALADAGRFPEARAAVVRSAELSGSEPDAESQLFLEWVDGCAAGDPVALGRDYDWVRRRATWQDLILDMADASTNMLNDPRIERGSKIEVSVNSLEAPSARLCLALHQGSGPDPRAVDYSFGEVPTPDPRLPRRDVRTLLWVERDGVMVQAVDPPSDEIRAVVAEVAAASSDLSAAWDAAERLAPGARDRLVEVASAMVYPPDVPDDETCVRWWLYRCQVAAACLIARADTRWVGSERRRLLLDLVRGPGDWTTASAVLVLGEIAVREPDAVDEIRRELLALAQAIPTTGHCAYGATLAVTATKIPLFREQVARALDAIWLSGHDSQAAEPAHERESEPEPESSTTRPWWKFWG
jgi:tetratricopeptide (TPR) repeat protein